MSSDHHGPIGKGPFFLLLPVPEPQTFVFEDDRQEPSLQVGDTLRHAAGEHHLALVFRHLHGTQVMAAKYTGSAHPLGPL